MSRRLALPALCLVALAACGVHQSGPPPVMGSSPRPRLHLERQNARIALLLPKDLPEKFVAQGGFEVLDFVGTLARGFEAGFGDAYFVNAHEADRYLEVTGIEVWFDSSARNRELAHVRYRARLLDRDRRELARYAGEARAHTTCWWRCTGSLESAVDAMYEDIADHLFWERAKDASSSAW